MKISIKGEHGLEFTATNPDESLKAYHRQKMTDALLAEFAAFIEDVFVAFRKLKPGETNVLESRPIRIEMSRPAETQAVEVAPQEPTP